jgi:hypothetical protein
MIEVRISSVEIRPNKEKEEAHKAKMQEVGEIINRKPPTWLRDVLSHFSFDFYSAHNIEAMWPTRSQLLDSLVGVGGLAVKLSNALDDWAMVPFLTSNSPTDLEAVSQLKYLLLKLAASAHQARNAPQLVASDGSILRGRGKTLLPGKMPGEYRCAAIVAEVWAFLNEKEPKSTTRRAWEAADKFWQSWVPSKPWGNKPNRWKHYFERVREPNLEPLRNEVRRHLQIHTHLAAVMLEK